MTDTPQRKAERLARLDRDLRRMTVLPRRSLLQRVGRRRTLGLRLRGQAL